MFDIHMELWQRRVQSFLKHGTPGQKMLVCCGAPGIGKTKMTIAACEAIGCLPVVCPGLGAQQPEDFLPIARLSEGGRLMVASMPGLMPVVEQRSKNMVIPWIIDECFSGDAMQDNQLRAALTERRIGSTTLPENVMMIGTTNPFTGDYSLVHKPDAALLDRIELINVYMPRLDHCNYLTSVGKPVECVRFLGNLDHAVWASRSPRFWDERFCGTWAELKAAHMTDDDIQTLMTHALGDGMCTLVAEFMASCTTAHDDPLTLCNLFQTEEGTRPWCALRRMSHDGRLVDIREILFNKEHLALVAHNMPKAHQRAAVNDFISRISIVIGGDMAEELLAAINGALGTSYKF